MIQNILRNKENFQKNSHKCEWREFFLIQFLFFIIIVLSLLFFLFKKSFFTFYFIFSVQMSIKISSYIKTRISRSSICKVFKRQYFLSFLGILSSLSDTDKHKCLWTFLVYIKIFVLFVSLSFQYIWNLNTAMY